MFGLLRPSPAASARTLPASYMSVNCDPCAVLSLKYGLTARPYVVYDLAARDGFWSPRTHLLWSSRG